MEKDVVVIGSGGAGLAAATPGLLVDGRARVLDENGTPVPGLYACGLDMNSLWRGVPPANGANQPA